MVHHCYEMSVSRSDLLEGCLNSGLTVVCEVFQRAQMVSFDLSGAGAEIAVSPAGGLTRVVWARRGRCYDGAPAWQTVPAVSSMFPALWSG